MPRGELALLAAGLIVSLALAEGLVRLWAPGSDAGGYAPVRTDGPERRPINSQGYRDIEREIPRPEGVRRVLCLGDSFTWGAGVLFDDAWPQRLERALSRGRGQRWEAVVLAEPGFNAVQLASRLESEGLPYDPDVVVFAWVLNDAEDLDSAETRRAADWVAEGQRRTPSASSLSRARSALVRLVRSRLEATRQNRERIRNFRSYYERLPRLGGGAAGVEDDGGALPRSKGIPLIVGIFPLFGNPLDEGYPFAEEHAQVARAAAERGGARRGPAALVPRLRWEILVVDGPRDEHPNEIAHRIAAQALAKAVDEVVPRDRVAGHEGAVDRPAPRGRARSPRRPRAPHHVRQRRHLRRGRAPARGVHPPDPRRPPAEPRAAAARQAARGGGAPAGSARWSRPTTWPGGPGRQWEFGRRFLYVWNDADQLLLLGRLPILGLTLILIAAVALAHPAPRRAPPPVSWPSPWRSCRPSCWPTAPSSPPTWPSRCSSSSPSPPSIGSPSAPPGVACSRPVSRPGPPSPPKFSGLVLGPILLVLAALVVAGDRPPESALVGLPRPVPGAAARIRLVLFLLVGIGCLALFVVWASYGFRGALSPDAAVRASQRVALESPPTPWQRSLVGAAEAGLIPEDYARGLLFVMTHSQARRTFLGGRLSDHGFALYFLVTFLLKTPIPLLLLVLLALARIPRLPPRTVAVVWAPVADLRGAHRGTRPPDRAPAPPAAPAVPPRGRGRGRGLPRPMAAARGGRPRLRPHGVVHGGHARQPPAPPRLLQRARRRPLSGLAPAGGLEPRLGAGPEAAQGLDGGPRGGGGQAVVLRQRLSELLRDPR